MHRTPPDALGPIVRETVIIDGRTFVIHRPSQSDKLLDHPAIAQAFAADEYMPYWPDIWPAARMLAKVVLREPWPGSLPVTGDRLEVLEVGCGLGLPGVAALARGLRVMFSDYDETAVGFAANNARANGFSDFRTRVVDWRNPPADLRVPVVLASDVTYEVRIVEPLVGFLKAGLVPGGVCLLTDQDRTPAPHLRERLAAAGLPYTTQMVRAGEPGGERYKGTLYRITNPG